MSRRSRAMLVRPRPLFDKIQVPPPLPDPAAAVWSNGQYDFETTAAGVERINRDGADGYRWLSAAGASGGSLRRYPSWDRTDAQGPIVNGPWEFEQQFWFDHPAPTTLTGTNWFSLATYLMIGQVSGAWNRVVALNFLGNKLQLYHVPVAGTGGPVSTVVFPTRQWVTVTTRQLADKTMQVEQDGVLLFTTSAIDVAGPAIYGLHFGPYSSDVCQDFIKGDGRLALRAIEVAVTAQGQNTQSATVTTEHTLLDVAVAGTFTLHVDTVNMVAGDRLELRIYQIILTGGTRRVAYYVAYDGAQPVDDRIKISVPISNELTDSGALRFSLKQTLGTSRDFPWKVLAY